MPKYANRRDHNQATITRVLEALGVVVVDMSKVGNGFPDLVCGYRNRIYVAETKNPETSYGRRGFNKNQKNFCRRWPTKVWKLMTEADVIAAVEEWSRS